MANNALHQDTKGVIELLEEAVHLLRLAPASTLACYYVGSLPLVLAVLYFWADMSRSAFAADHLAAAAMGVAVTLVWMKSWHAVFTRQLLAQLCGEEPPQWTLRRTARLVTVQAAIQPWGLIALPLAAVTVVFLPRIYAFFQNVGAFGDGDPQATPAATFGLAWRQAKVWPGQNTSVHLMMLPLVLVVLVNLGIAVLVPAFLLKTLLGVDTVFSRGGFRTMNTTFLAILLGLAYVCVDPVMKAFYTLRCFYGRSLRTGQDLRAELKTLAGARKGLTAVLLSALAVFAAANTSASEKRGQATFSREKVACPLFSCPLFSLATVDGGVGSGEPAAPAAAPAVTPEELSESIDEVITRREYTWRMPRDERSAEGAKSFFTSIADAFRAMRDKLRDWLQSDDEKQQPMPRYQPRGFDPTAVGWLSIVQPLIYILLAVVVVLLIGLVLLAWLKRRVQPAEAKADKSAQARPDLEDEDVTADDLPEQGWLDLAAEMLAKGDRRLALRALYLASLAMLAERELIRIAKHKSNRDYHDELARRRHALGPIVDAFGQNVRFFEDAWYGMHDVTESIVRAFATNHERIQSVAGT